MKHTFEAEFRIGDLVYHKLPESPKGMITGMSYNIVSRKVTYYVTFDPQQSEVQCYEWELTQEKVVI